jgi:chitinase
MMAYKLVGYFENWAQYRQGGGKFFPDQIDPSLLTHINFAFGLFGFVTWSVDPTETRSGDQRLTGDYSIQPVEWNDQTVLYPDIQKLKEKNPNLKTLLSIGGWSINSCDDQPNPGNPHPYGPFTCHLFSSMAADPQGRKQFIQSAISYAQQYGFDGIDIDWEYPGYIGRGGSDADFDNFLLLIQEFRAQAGPNFLLTWAAPAIVPTGVSASSPKKDPTTFFQWVAQCAQSFDWLNVMSYDFHGAFDDPVKVGTGVNAPLVQDSTPNGPFSLKNTVEAYLQAGIPKEKIVLGMPTYGRSFIVSSPLTATDNGYGKPFRDAGPAGPATQVPGVLAYYEILAQLANGNLVKQWDNATLTPYAYSSQTGEWVSYDDTDSLAYKVSYVLEQGLGGAMVWSIDDDDFSNGFPLFNSIKSVLDNPALRKPLPDALLAGPATSGNVWTGDQLIPGIGVNTGVGVAVFHSKIYCVHEGIQGAQNNGDGWLWYTTFDGDTWSQDQKLPDISTYGPPALVVFNDLLYCLHQGQGYPGQAGSGQLWYTTFDSATWSPDQLIPDVGIAQATSPAVVVYQRQLYCLHRGIGDPALGRLWYTSSADGTTWSKDQQVPNVGISGPPALVVFKEKLYCFHQGQGSSGQLWYTVFDGNTWSQDKLIPDIGLTTAPVVAVFNDQLYCVHEGLGADGWLWYTTSADGTTWAKDQKLNDGISGLAALVVFGDLYCLHEGQGQSGQLWLTKFLQGTWILAAGENSFVYAELDSAMTQQQEVNTTQTIFVPVGAPYLFATLTQNAKTTDFPGGAMLTITGPDGTKYNDVQSNDTCSTFLSDSSLQGLVVTDPPAGNYEIALIVPQGVPFRFVCETLPSQDVAQTLNNTLSTVNPTLQKRGLGLIIGIGAAVLESPLVALGFIGLGALWVMDSIQNASGKGKKGQNQTKKAVKAATGGRTNENQQQPNVSDATNALTRGATQDAPGLPTQWEKDPSLPTGNGYFLIDPQGGPQGGSLPIIFTDYRTFIRDLRGRMRARDDGGRSDFATRFDPNPAGGTPVPWFRQQASDLYLTNLNRTTRQDASRLRAPGWDTDLHAALPNYPEMGITVDLNTIENALRRLQDGGRPDQRQQNITIAAFIISEAARFDVVLNAVEAVLNGTLASVPWDDLRILITNWQASSQAIGGLGDRIGIAGITMQQSEQFFQEGGGFNGTREVAAKVLAFIDLLKQVGYQ